MYTSYAYSEPQREGRSSTRTIRHGSFVTRSSSRGYPQGSPSAYDHYYQGNTLGLQGTPPLATEPYRASYQIYGPPMAFPGGAASTSSLPPPRPPTRSASSGALSLYSPSRHQGSPGSFYSYDGFTASPPVMPIDPRMSYSAPAAMDVVPFPSTPRHRDSDSNSRSRPEQRKAQPAPILRSSSAHTQASRRRRRSSVSFAAGPPTVHLITEGLAPSTHLSNVNASSHQHSHRSNDRDQYNPSVRLGVIPIQRKDKPTTGVRIKEVSLPKSEGGPHLYGRDVYKYEDIHPTEGRVNLKVKWMNFPSLTYSIPVDESLNGHLRVSSFSRRIAKACMMYFREKGIDNHLHHIYLHRLEEIAYGTWQPVLMLQ